VPEARAAADVAPRANLLVQRYGLRQSRLMPDVANIIGAYLAEPASPAAGATLLPRIGTKVRNSR